MRKQFATLLEDTEKQLRELDTKLQDKDTLDGLSPEAEAEMRGRLAQLSEEMSRYNQQYYQFMQQGQHKIMQTVFGGISQASEKIAASKGYTMILNKQACFYSAPTLDVTAEMVKEMDKNFDDEAKKQAAAAATPSVEAKKEVAVTKEEAAKPAAPKAEESKSAADVKKP
jgi:outer membrane protein